MGLNKGFLLDVSDSEKHSVDLLGDHEHFFHLKKNADRRDVLEIIFVHFPKELKMAVFDNLKASFKDSECVVREAFFDWTERFVDVFNLIEQVIRLVGHAFGRVCVYEGFLNSIHLLIDLFIVILIEVINVDNLSVEKL